MNRQLALEFNNKETYIIPIWNNMLMHFDKYVDNYSIGR